MKRVAPFVLVSLVALAVAGCSLLDEQTIRGSGTTVTTTHELADFDGVEARRGFVAHLAPGDRFAVTVTADDSVVDHLEVEVEGTTLRLDVDDAVNLADATVMAEVTMPSLRRLVLHGGAVVDVRDFTGGGPLEARLTGGSTLTCADLRPATLTLELSGGSAASCRDIGADTLAIALDGGSRVTLSGRSATARIESTGASRADLEDLSAAGAEVILSGGSEASLTVSGVLEADLRNGSRLRYSGDPVLGRTDVASGSTLAPMASPTP